MTRSRLFGATLLVSGMSIGVGMLALPLVTANQGFFPAVCIYAISWLFMVTTGLIIAESCHWMGEETNLISIAKRLLGPYGASLCWAVYLFLFYAIMVAHMAVGGSAFAQIFGTSPSMSIFLYVALFSPITLLGTQSVDKVNRLLIAGVVITYLLFVIRGVEKIQIDLLMRSDWSNWWKALPVVVSAFGFQNMVPSLVTYLDRDRRQIRRAIWIGTAVPLLIYSLWQLLIQGIVPLYFLRQAAAQGQNAAAPLQQVLSDPWISSIASLFALFAMTTSYLCIALAFKDFWADGLQWKEPGIKKGAIWSLVFLIPLFITFANPSLFLEALGMAGGYGAMVLFGILPILFMWKGHQKGKPHAWHPLFLLPLLAFALFVVGVESNIF